MERASSRPDFPLAVADHLRAGGIELDVDAGGVRPAPARKTAPSSTGIRRAQKAADAAMAVAAELIRELRPG